MYKVPGVDITPSGSLGMLLSYGVGSAIESKNKGQKNNIIVFLGDGEEQEGNVSEAARHAASLGLENLICIIDKNGKQLSRPTKESDSKSDLETVWRGYGWNVEIIKDGHNINEILTVY
jgi:transketolase